LQLKGSGVEGGYGVYVGAAPHCAPIFTLFLCLYESIVGCEVEYRVSVLSRFFPLRVLAFFASGPGGSHGF